MAMLLPIYYQWLNKYFPYLGNPALTSCHNLRGFVYLCRLKKSGAKCWKH